MRGIIPARGVYCAGPLARPAGYGSSPLARGLQPPPGAIELQGRIIPARAGFTASGAPTASHGEDHPRSRGVYPEMVQELTERGGSSPLARGLQRAAELAEEAGGIIPARAGFTRDARHRPPA